MNTTQRVRILAGLVARYALIIVIGCLEGRIAGRVLDLLAATGLDETPRLVIDFLFGVALVFVTWAILGGYHKRCLEEIDGRTTHR